jgi:hypothetical protein
MDELLMRKEQLSEVIELEDQEIKRLWGALTTKDEQGSRGEQLAKYVSYGVMAYDGIMMLQKLRKGYGSFVNIFKR